MSLAETLVALAIALLMMAGAIAGYAKARDAYAVLEANARLQETARYALALLAPDVRMAGFWGLTNRSESITASASLGFPARCGGAAWVTDTQRFIDGSNNGWLPAPNCTALSGGAQPGADVLVIRRASATRIAPQSATVAAPNRDRVLVVTDRLQGTIFVPQDNSNVIPPGYATFDDPAPAPLADTRELLVHAYYVSASSSVATGYPALRRKTLTAGPDIGDEEIIAGIEDLQFQVGVRRRRGFAGRRVRQPWRRARHGETGFGAHLAATAIAGARQRLRRRSRRTYADRTANASGDHFRRLLVTQTLQLRNSQP